MKRIIARVTVLAFATSGIAVAAGTAAQAAVKPPAPIVWCVGSTDAPQLGHTRTGVDGPCS